MARTRGRRRLLCERHLRSTSQRANVHRFRAQGRRSPPPPPRSTRGAAGRTARSARATRPSRRRPYRTFRDDVAAGSVSRRRKPARSEIDHGLIGDAAPVGRAPALQVVDVLLRQPLPELEEEPRLSHAGRAADADHLTMTAHGRLEAASQAAPAPRAGRRSVTRRRPKPACSRPSSRYAAGRPLAPARPIGSRSNRRSRKRAVAALTRCCPARPARRGASISCRARALASASSSARSPT